MKLSVIIPVFNGAKYLDDCIRSIVDQTYRDLQIICIDDGSTDESLEILKSWSKNDTRIEVYTQSNAGVCSARNKGLGYATGELVTFVDCDDTVEPEMYKILLEQFEDSVDIVHCSYNKIPLKGERYVVGGSGKICIQTGHELCRLLISGQQITGSLWTKIYRRKILDDIEFNYNFKVNEDILFNYYAIKKTRKAVFVDCGLYNYFEHLDSSCKRTDSVICADDCMKVAEIIYENECESSLKEYAKNKYYMALCRQYRTYLYKKRDVKECEQKISRLMKSEIHVDKKYIYDFWFMKKAPYLYKPLYKVYNCIRKPNWDV